MSDIYPTDDPILSDAQRRELMLELSVNGSVILPHTISDTLLNQCLEALDRIAHEERQGDNNTAVKLTNIIDRDPIFRRLMLWTPALQLSYDAFGPSFHLCQSNLVSRPPNDNPSNNFIDATPWHSDGPRPRMLPHVGQSMGMIYLKFGFFFSDVTGPQDGPLKIIRGSHLSAEVAEQSRDVIETQYGDQLEAFHIPAGTVIAFHQAQWHAADAPYGDIERKNAYISYTPTWVKPMDRDLHHQDDIVNGTSDIERLLLGAYREPFQFWVPKQSKPEQWALNAYARQDGSVCSLFYPERGISPQP